MKTPIKMCLLFLVILLSNLGAESKYSVFSIEIKDSNITIGDLKFEDINLTIKDANISSTSFPYIFKIKSGNIEANRSKVFYKIEKESTLEIKGKIEINTDLKKISIENANAKLQKTIKTQSKFNSCEGENPCIDMFLVYNQDQATNKDYGNVIISTYYKAYKHLVLYANVSLINYKYTKTDDNSTAKVVKTRSGTFGLFVYGMGPNFQTKHIQKDMKWGLLIEGTGYQIDEDNAISYKRSAYLGNRFMFSRFSYFDILYGYETDLDKKRWMFRGQSEVIDNIIIGAEYNFREGTSKDATDQSRFNIYAKVPLSKNLIRNIFNIQ